MSAAASSPRLCIVAHGAWGAINGGTSGHAGGVEHQTALTARWLAARGLDVSLVVWDEGQPPEVRVDGVRVIRVCRRHAGLPGLRFVHPRWTSLVGALRAADADLYYQNCGEYVTGQVALWCRANRRRFVFSVASDPECDPRLPAMRTRRERTLYRCGLRRADRIIVQTARQQRMLRDGFGLASVPLPMPCAAPAADYDPARLPDSPPRFVWVGRISREKDPERLIAIAQALPGLQFDLAGPAPDDWARAVAARAAVANVRVLGRIPRAGMAAVYRGATALVCTSLYEGFPNTFLEAWSHGVPVVTTFDPDDLVATHGLGTVAADRDGLVAAVRRFATDAAARTAAARRARAYYEAHHEPDRALARFAAELLDVCRPSPRPLDDPMRGRLPEAPCAR